MEGFYMAKNGHQSDDMELHYFIFIRILFSRARLKITIFLLILG